MCGPMPVHACRIPYYSLVLVAITLPRDHSTLLPATYIPYLALPEGPMPTVWFTLLWDLPNYSDIFVCAFCIPSTHWTLPACAPCPPPPSPCLCCPCLWHYTWDYPLPKLPRLLPRDTFTQDPMDGGLLCLPPACAFLFCGFDHVFAPCLHTHWTCITPAFAHRSANPAPFPTHTFLPGPVLYLPPATCHLPAHPCALPHCLPCPTTPDGDMHLVTCL